MEFDSNKKEFLPYVGPRPFQNNSHDRAVFYGRDYESQEIISLILANFIVLVYSQSGSGKTSLFNTKIYPTLAEQYDFQVFPTALVRGAIPEDLDIVKIPNLYIFNTLQRLNPNSNPMALQNEDLASFLKQYPNLLSDIDNNKDREEPSLKLIVFDQFEDFFNIFPSNDWQTQQNDFFIQIIKALENDSSLRIVFVMREEYVAQLDPFAYNLSGKLRARFRLEPLRRDAALLAVTQPLKNTGVSFAPGVAEELVDNLTKIHVEDVFHKPTITKGEYVEPVHLQVVCQRLWNKVVSQSLTQITRDQLEDVDAALKEFYEEAVHDTAKQTRIKENVIRDWCEDKLITTTGTRSIIHQEYDSTGGLSNEAVSVLASKHLIREESRFGATWIELTHDRLIEPIKEANKKWHDEQYKSKRSFRIKVLLPIAVITIIGISIFASNTYTQQQQQISQQQRHISQQQNLISQLLNTSESLFTKNPVAAIKTLNKVLTIDPNNEIALQAKGAALTNLRNYTQAMPYIDKALAIDPNNSAALNSKGNALAGFHNYTQAIQYYDRALTIDPNYKDALFSKGAALYGLGNYPQAIQYYDRALTIDPSYKDAINGKGNVLYGLGNYPQAIQYFGKALAIDPNDEIALTGKGLALDNLGNHTQAIQYYNKALGRDPKSKIALNGKGFALAMLGRYNEGLIFIDEALARDPKNAGILDSKGFTLDGLGRHNEAIALYNKALSIDPKNTDALVHKGKSLDSLGRRNEAIALYNKALSIDPKNTDAKNAKRADFGALNNQKKTSSSSNQNTNHITSVSFPHIFSRNSTEAERQLQSFYCRFTEWL
jgi:tetratricopeptide (TPR) repeat protein